MASSLFPTTGASGALGAPGAPGAPDGGPSVTVNGETLDLAALPAWTSALDLLRACGLTGAKEGCAEGECGACSVLVARPGFAPDGSPEGTQWTAINACLIPAASLDGQEVVTAEGLGTPTALHPVQREMALRGGSQCGYCTPGFVCSMAAEYYRPRRCGTRDPSDRSDRAATRTGREPRDDTRADSRAAVSSQESRMASDRSDGAATRSDGEHGQQGDPEHGPNGFDLHALSGNLCRCTGYRPIRDAAYALGAPEETDPFAVRLHQAPPAAVATRLDTTAGSYSRAADLADVFALMAQHPDAVLVAGSTDWGVEVNLRGTRAGQVIGIDRVEQLRGLTIGDDTIEIGAALTLSEVETRLEGRVPLLDEVFPQFASRLIRNGATIGGNLGTGSPIGDTPPALLALEAGVVLASARGEREVPLADYFTGYRQTQRRPDEVIRAVRIPLPLSPVVAFHKIAKRRFDDISSVAVGFALTISDGVVEKARIGLGGVAATPVRALATEAALEGRPWTKDVVRAAAAVMRREGTPMDDHRASAAYRSTMLGTALLKLHAQNATPQEVGA